MLYFGLFRALFFIREKVFRIVEYILFILLSSMFPQSNIFQNEFCKIVEILRWEKIQSISEELVQIIDFGNEFILKVARFVISRLLGNFNVPALFRSSQGWRQR